MIYYNTIPFVIVDHLDVQHIKECVFAIPSSLVNNITLETLLKLQSLHAFVVVKNTIDSNIDELVLFSDNYLKFDEKPIVFEKSDIENIDQPFTDELSITQLNKETFTPTFYSLEKSRLHPRVSKNTRYANILNDYSDFNRLVLDKSKIELQIGVLEDSLKANKIESTKEINYYKTEMIKRENWAKKNPELSFWELIKYLVRKTLRS